MLRIGVSAAFQPPELNHPVFPGRRLLYLEESLGHWLLSHGVAPFLIPTTHSRSPVKLKDLVQQLDALVLQGGTDVSPRTYMEEPLDPAWVGDFERDQYEIELIRVFMEQGKPVLGICRGMQLLNVAMGGTLYQHLPSQLETAGQHFDPKHRYKCVHSVSFEIGSRLQKLYPGTKLFRVNSMHHQAIRILGQGLQVEARGDTDGVVEAISVKDRPEILGVQWHPEFLPWADPTLLQDQLFLDPRPLLMEFLSEAKKRQHKS